MVSARSDRPVSRTPALIRIAGLGSALGIALSLTDYVDYGRWVTAAGVLLLLVSLHRFGRSGPDEPIHFELPPSRKNRKKKKRAAATSVDASGPGSEG